MHKLLYIASYSGKGISGGSMGRQMNYQLLSECNIQLFSYLIDVNVSKTKKILSVLRGYKNGLTEKHIKNIIRFIHDKNITLIFLDSSLYGVLIKKVYDMYKNISIISFFHNCEYKLYSDIYKNTICFYRYFLLKSVFLNEQKTLLYSKINIFLNLRDFNTCHDYYKIENISSTYSPIALEDKYLLSKEDISSPLFEPDTLLFVGSYFLPNINGLLWFDENVLPYIDYKLTIVGKGFEHNEFVSRLKCKDKIIVKGFVEDLNIEYREADIVIQPVFEGSGMKTKTAECFMYGKILLSSSEGLIGYEIDNIKNIYTCNSKEDYITILNKLKQDRVYRFNPELRNLFLEKYSKKSRKKVFFNLLNELEN
jgi:hypothetical protein